MVEFYFTSNNLFDGNKVFVSGNFNPDLSSIIERGDNLYYTTSSHCSRMNSAVQD